MTDLARSATTKAVYMSNIANSSAYDAIELTIRVGEILACHKEESGFIWVTNQAGQNGWVPSNQVELYPQIDCDSRGHLGGRRSSWSADSPHRCAPAHPRYGRVRTAEHLQHAALGGGVLSLASASKEWCWAVGRQMRVPANSCAGKVRGHGRLARRNRS